MTKIRKFFKKFDYVDQFERDRISRWVGIIGIYFINIPMISNGWYLESFVYSFFVTTILLLLMHIELGSVHYIWSLFVGTTIRTRLTFKLFFVIEEDEQEAILECLKWLDDTISPNCYRQCRGGSIIFLFRQDAMHFKLVFGGNKYILPNKKGS